MIERISFEVHDILAGDNRAVILGSLVSKLKQTGKIIKTDFAIVLTVANREIFRFQMLEDSVHNDLPLCDLCKELGMARTTL